MSEHSSASTSSYDVATPDWAELYSHLHKIASAQMSRERSGHILQTTAVVHEAYVRLSKENASQFKDKNSFFAAASVVMRRVLVDSARKEKAVKRGGNATKKSLTDTQLSVGDKGYSVIEIHDCLSKLAEFASDQAQALELMIFGGLTGEETAAVMGVSASTIDRKVRSAKAWLRRELSDGEHE